MKHIIVEFTPAEAMEFINQYANNFEYRNGGTTPISAFAVVCEKLRKEINRRLEIED